MDRRVYILKSPKQRAFVANVVATLQKDWRIEIKGPKRTVDQNSLMWVWLSAYADQATYHGEKLTAGDWKDLFTGALKAAQNGLRIVPGLDGGLMVLGLRTSDMSVAEMGDLITFMQSKADDFGVVLDDAARDAAGDNPVAAAA